MAHDHPAQQSHTSIRRSTCDDASATDDGEGDGGADT